ncbi:hypothetical protein GA0116948_11065 [Chitinophaga costaii]|uniref:Conjugal transfer protein TraI n=1 Tax=Chitinophaga costaii TaxID=1335309 RepID=A0A1C4EWH0_9BACT|nr:conjugal transfer protein TraI [Chitinophaga costaii]PUZ21594.1 conjugal transfer protein TraI [Chitinophaga costaii]SCC47998.1 hypothetical protein GA0116948_11065 [Chitinophaga costaii]
MRRILTVFMLCLCSVCTCLPTQQAHAFIITVVIKEAIKKVVKAVDLAIQKIQTKTIKLQAAQKVLENTLSKLKLKEIATWNDSSRVIYTKYFNELAKVKNVISYYQKIKDIIGIQKSIISDYKQALLVLQQDPHFTPQEAQHLLEVYGGILQQAGNNVDELMLVISSFKTTMSDAMRLELISKVHDQMLRNQSDLRRFNAQNRMLSLYRTKGANEVDLMRRLYGLH